MPQQLGERERKRERYRVFFGRTRGWVSQTVVDVSGARSTSRRRRRRLPSPTSQVIPPLLLLLRRAGANVDKNCLPLFEEKKSFAARHPISVIVNTRRLNEPPARAPALFPKPEILFFDIQIERRKCCRPSSSQCDICWALWNWIPSRCRLRLITKEPTCCWHFFLVFGLPPTLKQ